MNGDITLTGLLFVGGQLVVRLAVSLLGDTVPAQHGQVRLRGMVKMHVFANSNACDVRQRSDCPVHRQKQPIDKSADFSTFMECSIALEQ